MCTHRLLIESPGVIEGSITCSCILELQGETALTFSFFIPERFSDSLSASADPFLLISLFTALKRGGVLRVEGNVSPALLRTLPEFIDAWCAWKPKEYFPLTVEATSSVPSAEGNSVVSTLMPFSGGLDSCHTLWEQVKGEQRPVAALMVHGFDIPLEDTSGFEVAYQKTKAILDSVDVPAMSIATNVRAHGGNWEHEHGVALAACLHLFSGGFNRGIISGSHSYTTLRFPWGSNPLTDPLLSSERMPISYYGAGFSRNKKAKSVAEWPVAMENLRTCWKNPNNSENCGKCSTCISTVLSFAAEGVVPPSCYNVGSLDAAVRLLSTLKMTDVGLQRLEDSVYCPAKQNGIKGTWLDLLEAHLCYHKRCRSIKRCKAALKQIIRPRIKCKSR